jgi:antimicrobial peptide system SdpB family protein
MSRLPRFDPIQPGDEDDSMASLEDQWARFVEFSSRDRFLVGASLLRVIAGVMALYEYLINYAQRRYLFGPDGVWPWDYFVTESRHLSIYALSTSPRYFEIAFHMGVLIAFLWTIGWRTRWLTPVHYVFWWSLHQRHPLIWDGGDNVMQLVLVYSFFADLGAHFSVDADRRESRAATRSAGERMRAMFHNAAMLAIACQICLVYGVAGLTKVQGETWRNGTALYYALRDSEFTWPGHSELIYHNVTLLTCLSYLTVAFQIAFSFFLFGNRVTRTLIILSGLMFHLCIALYFGLVSFAGFLIAVDLSLIGDAEYLALARRARSLGKLVRMWLSSRRKERTTSHVQVFKVVESDIQSKEK